MLLSKRFHLGRSKILDFLDELASTDREAVSVYLPQGTSRDRAEDVLGKVFAAGVVPTGVTDAIVGSAVGAAFFRSPTQAYLVLPPFPIAEEYVTNSYDAEPLRSLLGRDFAIALVLIRLGAYSIGICRGTELICSKTGTGLVHARHKKGGSSQARFARHREKQIEQFLIRVCGHVRAHIEPHARLLDYLVYGGARSSILLLRKQCPFLSQFDDHILRMLLDIPDPRRPVLQKAVSTVWSTDIIEWREADS